MKKNLSILSTIVILLLLIAAGYYFWKRQAYFPSTDDAYVQANVINIAPRVPGTITQVPVQNSQHVASGQLLFAIDPEPYQLAVNSAQAQRDNAIQQMKGAIMEVASMQALISEREAELTESQQNYDRIMSLVKKKLYPPSAGDEATRQLNVAKAGMRVSQSQLAEAQQKLGALDEKNPQVQAASATLAKAKLDLQYTRALAPASGSIANLSLRQGDQVSAYQPLFALVEDEHWWVSANFKETQLLRIKLGQRVTLHIDMYPDRIFHGHVDSISSGSGASFSILPPENATGNWVKVTQRFPIKIIIDDLDAHTPLRMGASCAVSVDTQSAPVIVDINTLSESR